MLDALLRVLLPSRLVKAGGGSSGPQWTRRDWIAGAVLFLATAGVVLWQNAHVAVLFDLSYILNTAARIALGQMPYRDFPLAHAPLTFLMQAAIIRLTGRVIFHHVLYAALIGGLGTVLAWRIALRSLLGRVAAAWPIALLVAVPLTVLGVYSIVPNPEYDCDCGFWILVAIWMVQRLDAESTGAFGFAAGVVLCVPVFFKQNMGLPLLAAALAAIVILIGAKMIRGGGAGKDFAGELRSLELEETASGAKAHVNTESFAARLKSCPVTIHSNIEFLSPDVSSCSDPRPHGLHARESFSEACSAGPEVSQLLAVATGMCVTLAAAVLALHWTVGLGNYIHWTIEYAGQRRLPGFSLMLEPYRDPSLLWTLPCVVIALIVLHSPLAKVRWAQFAAFALMAAPFLFTLASLLIYDDADGRGDALLTLWPLLMILAVALTIVNLFRLRHESSLRMFLPLLLLAAIHGTFMSQQLWGSTYGIWPLLALLVAELLVFVEGRAASTWFVPGLAALVSVTLLVCGGFYMASEERLSYANFPDGPPAHSAFPQLAGLATPGPYLPEFDELLRYTEAKIPFDDGIVLIPGEEPFYIATNRVPKFPVPFFDPLIDPYSPAEIVSLVRSHNIRWLIVKRDVQTKEDPTPHREALMTELMSEFTIAVQLRGYDVYERK